MPEQPTVSADIDLAIGPRRLQARVEVPAGMTPLLQLLPLVRSLTGAAVSAAAEDAAAHGKPLSCRTGCAACCRHLVPLTQAEARRLAAVVEAMPEPRRSEVRARFGAAVRRAAEAGLLEWLRRDSPWEESNSHTRGLDYVRLHIDCPFLENEACSIYEERPLVCREYVVVSPAEECSNPGSDRVQVVKLPFEAWRALARLERPAGEEKVAWVPLPLALGWADAHPEQPPDRTGPELLAEFFRNLTGGTVPGPPGADKSQDTP